MKNLIHSHSIQSIARYVQHMIAKMLYVRSPSFHNFFTRVQVCDGSVQFFAANCRVYIKLWFPTYFLYGTLDQLILLL